MDVVENVRQSVDIVQVIQEVVPLKKRGRDFLGLCPFHGEKTPSFSVSPTKQVFYCFGCHVGGNVFNFVQKFYNWDFQQALEELARKAGIKIDSFKSDPLWAEGLEILQTVGEFFVDELRSKDGKEFRDYLKRRKIPEKLWADFRLGAHLGHSHAVTELLEKKKFSRDMGVQLGILGRSATGEYFDRFRGRLIFPIIDEKQRIRGFGGRSLGEEQPKYLNSPKSPIFDKGRLFYGMHLAQNQVGKKGYAVLVEGYLDVMALHEYGVTNALGSMGTALTFEQIRILKRMSSRVISLYDADRAGLAATEKNLGNFLREGIESKVVLLPTGKDPDAFLHQEGVPADELKSQLKNSFEKSTLAIDFLLKNSVLNEKSPMQRAKRLRDLVRILDEIPDELERNFIKKDLAKRFELSESLFLQTRSQTQPPMAARVVPKLPENSTFEERWEREILRFAVQNGERMAFALTDLIPYLSSASRWSLLIERLAELGKDSGAIAKLNWLTEFDSTVLDDSQKSVINGWVFGESPSLSADELEIHWKDLKAGLMKFYYAEQSRRLQEEITSAELAQDQSKVLKLLAEKRDVMMVLKSIE